MKLQREIGRFQLSKALELKDYNQQSPQLIND